MPKANTTVVKLVREFLELDQVAKEATSILNKKNTELKNAVKKALEENKAPYGSYYVVDGVRISFEASVSDGIAAEDLMDQYEQGDITREQFLACVKVGMEDTKNTLGGDVVEALKQPITGKTVDLRKKTLPVEEHTKVPQLVIVGAPVVKRRKIGGTGALTEKPTEVSETTAKKPTRRRINVRK